MKKVIALSAVLVMGALGMACGDSGAGNAAANANKAVANAMNTANAAMANAGNAVNSAMNTANSAMANVANAVKSATNTANSAPAANAANANAKKP